MLDEEAARGKVQEFLDSQRGRLKGRVARELARPILESAKMPDGSWRFIFARRSMTKVSDVGVVVRSNGDTFAVLGAIGNGFWPPILEEESGNPLVRSAWNDLGLPRSGERWLGSGIGKYQLFDKGFAVFEGGAVNVGFPVRPKDTDVGGRKCSAMVAFTDLRGSTTWAEKTNPEEVQNVISKLEELLQDVFLTSWCDGLFLKGTGDGAMIVSEAGWYRADEIPSDTVAETGKEAKVTAEHAISLLRVCSEFVVRSKDAVIDHPELAMGCGVHLGDLHQVYLQGRRDYLGPPANKAAKIQQLAWDEVCITPELYDFLDDNVSDLGTLLGKPKRLADRGYRIDPEVLANPA